MRCAGLPTRRAGRECLRGDLMDFTVHLPKGPAWLRGATLQIRITPPRNPLIGRSDLFHAFCRSAGPPLLQRSVHGVLISTFFPLHPGLPLLKRDDGGLSLSRAVIPQDDLAQ